MEVAKMARCEILTNRFKLINRILRRNCCVTVHGAKAGNDGFVQDYSKCHLETSPFQKTLLGIGSAVVSLSDPRRGDMIAAMGETTGLKALENVYAKMAASEEGQRILKEKPRINSSTIDLEKLRDLKDGTVGKTYSEFLDRYNYTPDARLAVRFVDDIELAYVVQRYREVHDLFHSILKMPTNMLGEVTVKWVEAIQTRMPMCIGGAIFGAARLAPKNCRHYSTQVVLDDAIMEDDKSHFKRHPGIRNKKNTRIPELIENAIIAILEEKKIPKLIEEAEKLRNYLHSRKLPVEESDVKQKRTEYYDQVKNEMPEMDENALEADKIYAHKRIMSKVGVLLRSRLYHWKPVVMNEMTSYLYLASRAAAEYSVVCRVLNEIVCKDANFSPKFLFDFGSGVGTVSWAAQQLWGKSLKEYFTVDISSDMNELALRILQLNDANKKPFVKNLFQRQFFPTSPTQYDLVVSAYSLLELDSSRTRYETISNLWAKTNKYLVIIEQGTNAGFRLIEEARDIVLRSQKTGHVFAPCPHNLACPRIGQPTPCNFTTTYTNLKKFYNHATKCNEYFSFVILKKGTRDENDPQWPRIVRETLPRHNHVICRLCTASGDLKEIIFTRSKHGKSLYKCARRSTWGDLIPVSLKND